jgi:hypothetical protein
MKTLLIIILLFWSAYVFAPSAKSLFIEMPDKIKPFERILKACIAIESGGDSLAYSFKENAAGILQIRPIMLKQYYIETGIRYTTNDCFYPAVSREIFMHFATQFNPNDLKGICRVWNGKSKSNQYYNKIKSWK